MTEAENEAESDDRGAAWRPGFDAGHARLHPARPRDRASRGLPPRAIASMAGSQRCAAPSSRRCGRRGSGWEAGLNDARGRSRSSLPEPTLRAGAGGSERKLSFLNPGGLLGSRLAPPPGPPSSARTPAGGACDLPAAATSGRPSPGIRRPRHAGPRARRGRRGRVARAAARREHRRRVSARAAESAVGLAGQGLRT